MTVGNDEDDQHFRLAGAKRRDSPPGPSPAAQRVRRHGLPSSAPVEPAAAILVPPAPAPTPLLPGPLPSSTQDEVQALLQLGVATDSLTNQYSMQSLVAGQQSCLASALPVSSSAPISATAAVSFQGTALPASTTSGKRALAKPVAGSVTMTPHTAPTSAEKSEEAEAGWLAAMQLTPLVDLRVLGDALETPAFGWVGVTSPAAAATAVHGLQGEERTPAAFVRVCMGTPPSQALGLPHPSAPDFGGPSIPDVAPEGSRRRGAAPEGTYPQGATKDASMAAAASGCNGPLHPQSSSAAACVPAAVMTLPLRPALQLGQEGSALLVPVNAALPGTPPQEVATAAAFGSGLPLPRGTVPGAGATAPGAEAVLPTGAATAALAAPAPAPSVPPGLPPVGSSLHAMLKRVPGGHLSTSQPRLQRQRTQQQRSAEYDWGGSEGEQESVSGRDGDEEWHLEAELSDSMLPTDSTSAWRTTTRWVVFGESRREAGCSVLRHAHLAAMQRGLKAWWLPSRKKMQACCMTARPNWVPSPPLSCRSSLASASAGSNSGASSSADSTAPSTSRPRRGGSAHGNGSGRKRGSSKAGGGRGSSSPDASQLLRSSNTPSLQQQLQLISMRKQLARLAHLAAPQAAKAMGLSQNNFRALCRGIGIQRWPGAADEG